MPVNRCPRCSAEVIEGRDDTGQDVRLEPQPLTPLDELGHTMAGRSTYTRHLASGVIAYRGAHVILERPAGTRTRQQVHAEHRCTRGQS